MISAASRKGDLIHIKAHHELFNAGVCTLHRTCPVSSGDLALMCHGYVNVWLQPVRQLEAGVNWIGFDPMGHKPYNCTVPLRVALRCSCYSAPRPCAMGLRWEGLGGAEWQLSHHRDGAPITHWGPVSHKR